VSRPPAGRAGIENRFETRLEYDPIVIGRKVIAWFVVFVFLGRRKFSPNFFLDASTSLGINFKVTTPIAIGARLKRNSLISVFYFFVSPRS